jgi:hypothetical protein
MTDTELQKMAEVFTQHDNNAQRMQAALEEMAEVFTQHDNNAQRIQAALEESISCKKELEDIRLGNVRSSNQYGDVIVVQHKDYQWGVIDTKGRVIVPFGKYGWIDGFDHGLARVRTHKHSGRVGCTIAIIENLFDIDGRTIEGKENIQRFYDNDRKKHPEKYAKWGIINEKGEEVLPVIYDDVWNFFGKDRYSTRVELNGEYEDVYFHDLNPSLPVRGIENHYSSSSDYDDYSDDYFDINNCYDSEGYFDEERLEDAFFSGEYLPEDW